MAWCDNRNCGKTNLLKTDVEFDEELKMVLCHGCYCLRHPGWVPPTDTMPLPVAAGDPKLRYELRFTNEMGFAARIGFGDLVVSFHAPMQDIRRLWGGNPRFQGL